jgi:hypothetical protein
MSSPLFNNCRFVQFYHDQFRHAYVYSNHPAIVLAEHFHIKKPFLLIGRKGFFRGTTKIPFAGHFGEVIGSRPAWPILFSQATPERLQHSNFRMRLQPWRILSGGLKMPTPLHQRIFYSNSKGWNGFCQEIAAFLNQALSQHTVDKRNNRLPHLLI